MIVIAYLMMLVVGFILGLIGGGGAILTMPILVYLFQFPPVLATSYSLFIVGAVSAIGVWRYYRQGIVNIRQAMPFVLPSLLGTFVARRILLPSVPEVVLATEGMMLTKGELIMAVFGVIMTTAAFSMIRPKTEVVPQFNNLGYQKLKLPVLGFLVGALAGFVGAGGGFLIIPALVMVGGMTMRRAVPTSLLIISINCLVGFAGDLVSGITIDGVFLAATTMLAGLGLLAGIAFAPRCNPSQLKTGFGWLVLIMGIWILAKQIFHFHS